MNVIECFFIRFCRIQRSSKRPKVCETPKLHASRASPWLMVARRTSNAARNGAVKSATASNCDAACCESQTSEMTPWHSVHSLYCGEKSNVEYNCFAEFHRVSHIRCFNPWSPCFFKSLQLGLHRFHISVQSVTSLHNNLHGLGHSCTRPATPWTLPHTVEQSQCHCCCCFTSHASQLINHSDSLHLCASPLLSKTVTTPILKAAAMLKSRSSRSS